MKEKRVKLVSNTRIYLDMEKLFGIILDVTPNFPKAYKFTIGDYMHRISVDLLQEVASAYMTKDKEERLRHLTAFQTKFQTLKTLIRTAGERRWIKGCGKYATIIELEDGIGRQSSAWKISLEKGEPLELEGQD